MHDLLCLLDGGPADCANLPMVLGTYPWPCLIRHRNNHSRMDIQITNQQVILAQKYQHYWDLYQSQQFLRLTPQATAELQSIVTGKQIGRAHV